MKRSEQSNIFKSTWQKILIEANGKISPQMTKLINKAKKKKKTVRMKFIYCCYNANTDLFKVPLIGNTCDDHEN